MPLVTGHTPAAGIIQMMAPVLTTPARYRITGITRDSSGAALAACSIDVFETATDTRTFSTVSDANGAYSVEVDGDRTYYLVAYLPGSPDVEGTSINTLTGS